MYKIGDFSKIVDLPVRTLRYYAEVGVLEPTYTDEFTGYKYYSEESISECELIKLLRSVEFTLDEIREYKNCLDEEILENKKKELENRINILKSECQRITCIEEVLKSGNETSVSKETEEIKVLRREYEKRNIGKCA